MSPLNRLARGLLEYWFPVLLTVFVVLAAAGGVWVGTHVTVPDPAPEFALLSDAVYRAEVGGVWFVIVYLGIMAVTLAFEGRGFVRFGPRGVEAGRLRKKLRARRKSSRSVKRLQKGLKTVYVSIKALTAAVHDLYARQSQVEEVQRDQGERTELLAALVEELREDKQALKEEVVALQQRIDSGL
jgi:hypothetical protein